MKPKPYGRVLARLAKDYDIDRFRRANGESPFRVLVSCVISLRTKDEVTYPATERLFALARDPRGMAALTEAAIAKAIYPAGFYRTKARQIRALSRLLIERHSGRVPDEIDALVELPGVGRKTANLTVTLGYGKPGICVDTHVHRIAGRLGWTATRSPDRTEEALRATLPRRWWIPINETLVRHGQAVCHPVSPRCSMCTVARLCPRVGVARSR
ncbi:MAG TPA: endonuclease III [Candidatus Polarisedimenticolaceae bacterium]|nr:endonuclease III [Candidatus Polarisedimenticolaceae bacterium]